MPNTTKPDLATQLAEAKATIAKLKRALRFYANTDNHFPRDTDVVGVTHDGKMMFGDGKVKDEAGGRARRALGLPEDPCLLCKRPVANGHRSYCDTCCP